jgi:hypothetical protein
VRRAVLEARIDEAKMWAIGCGSRWSKRIRDEFIEKELTLMKECKLLTQLQADRLAELEKQLKELEEMK